MRYLCLSLTMELGRSVKPVTRTKEPSAVRFGALKDSLATAKAAPCSSGRYPHRSGDRSISVGTRRHLREAP